MVEGMVATRRQPYELVVRARFDLLLPPRPLNLTTLSAAAYGTYVVAQPHPLAATKVTSTHPTAAGEKGRVAEARRRRLLQRWLGRRLCLFG